MAAEVLVVAHGEGSQQSGEHGRKKEWSEDASVPGYVCHLRNSYEYDSWRTAGAVRG